jgi:hypothetical protein
VTIESDLFKKDQEMVLRGPVRSVCSRLTFNSVSGLSPLISALCQSLVSRRLPLEYRPVCTHTRTCTRAQGGGVARTVAAVKADLYLCAMEMPRHKVIGANHLW